MGYNSSGGVPSIIGLEIIHMAGKINVARLYDANWLRKQHEAGLSVIDICALTGLRSHNSIRRKIKAAGGVMRGNLIRMKREGPEGRQRLTRAAHDAIRGKKKSEGWLLRRAAARVRVIGIGEEEVLFAIKAAGLNTEAQWPCGRYNIDIAVGDTVAVEICTGPNLSLEGAGRIDKRVEYINAAGRCVIYIVVNCYKPEAITGNLEYIIAFIQQADRDPATRSKNWVIDCRSYHFTRIRNKLGQLTAVKTPVRFTHTLSELNFGVARKTVD